ncbi:MAG TPA: SPOCS domain-containing protein [Lachnospiraceae bacterium]|nr:SPOCS domain-containing protein [Lachnospiraceae bacterium]
MELIKKNIHMNKLKCKSSVQLTLDDDFNVPDAKPDIASMIKEQGNIVIHEIKALNGKLLVKGALLFNILYISDEDARPVHHISGSIPFDESINMDDACSDDNIVVKWELEDLNTGLINSRKVSVKAIVGFLFAVEDVYDEETAVDVDGDCNIQSRKKRMNITQVSVNKKDTFRIKDEVTLPSNKPNIFEILYSEVDLRNLDTRLQDDKISMKGELLLFVLYASEDEEHPIQYIETEVPFSGTIDCNGCREEMIPDMEITIASKDIEVKPDADGEERVVDIEVVLNLDIKAYEEENLEILSDLYSTAKDVTPIIKDAYYENLLIKNNSKARITDRIKKKEDQPAIMQICNACGSVKIDEMQIVDNGIEVDGVIEVQVMYITDEDRKPLSSIKGIIPFVQTIEVKQLKPNSVYDVKPNLESISVILLDSDEIEVKAGVNLGTIVFDMITEPIITGISEKEINLDMLQEMPSIVGYITKPQETLWSIAKKYYTTVDKLKEINQLEQDTIHPGDKLLIVKAVDAIL